MVTKKGEWRIIAEKYPCLTCNAAPGESCCSPGGRIAKEVHVARSRLASAAHWHDPDEEMDEQSHDSDRRI